MIMMGARRYVLNYVLYAFDERIKRCFKAMDQPGHVTRFILYQHFSFCNRRKKSSILTKCRGKFVFIVETKSK